MKDIVILRIFPCFFIGLMLLFVMPFQFEHLAIKETSSNKILRKFSLQSIIPPLRPIQGVIIAPNGTDDCYKLKNSTTENTTIILLISTSGCHINDKLITATRAGYSWVIFYDDDKSNHLNWDSHSPLLHLQLKLNFDYVGEIDVEDAEAIKAAYLYPDTMSFSGVIQSHGAAFHAWITIVEFYSVRFSAQTILMFLIVGFIIAVSVGLQLNSGVDDPIKIICLVCLEILESTESCILPCTHDFHTHCIRNWFRSDRRHRCPVCRYKVMSTDDNFYDLSDHDSSDEEESEDAIRASRLREVLHILRENLRTEDVLTLNID